MQSLKTLSDPYQCYIAGNLPKKSFEGILFQYVLDNCEYCRFLGQDKSSWEDFVCWLYPRLVRAIDMYRDLGSSFDAYITALVHGASKEYRCREADHRITEYACWQARAQEMCVCENEDEYPEYQNDICIPKGIKSRQILLLLLKSYYFASDDFVEKVARTIDMETETIMRMISELKKLRCEKETERMDLRDRLYCQHYRCLTYQKRMNAAEAGTEYRRKMERRYERAQRRFMNMKKRLGKMRVGPSNRMIAEVMGIPKGTVDSSLSAIKNHLGSFSGNATP
ncbi:MAG: hypothetical protein FWC65_00725 [Treponema sp.]|nr:hypothetical protein [Treponema sp.]